MRLIGLAGSSVLGCLTVGCSGLIGGGLCGAARGRVRITVWPVPAPAAAPRPFGLCAGRFTVPTDFDQPLPEDILQEFEGA